MDELKLLTGRDITIYTDEDVPHKIILHQPRLREICDFGEEAYVTTFSNLCLIPSDIKSLLWDAETRIDYMKISDFELFIRLSRGVKADDTRLILGDLDLSKMIPLMVRETSEPVLYDKDTDLIINEKTYTEIITYIRAMFGIVPKVEKAKNKFTKQVLIDEDRMRREQQEKNKTKFSSILVPKIITAVNTEELCYTYDSIFEITQYQLTKSILQINNKKEKCALMQGRYSGFIDTKKIKAENLYWMYKD